MSPQPPPEKWIGICPGRNDREIAAINRVMIKTPQESLLLNKNFIKNFISSHLRCYYHYHVNEKASYCSDYHSDLLDRITLL